MEWHCQLCGCLPPLLRSETVDVVYYALIYARCRRLRSTLHAYIPPSPFTTRSSFARSACVLLCAVFARVCVLHNNRLPFSVRHVANSTFACLAWRSEIPIERAWIASARRILLSITTRYYTQCRWCRAKCAQFLYCTHPMLLLADGCLCLRTYLALQWIYSTSAWLFTIFIRWLQIHPAFTSQSERIKRIKRTEIFCIFCNVEEKSAGKTLSFLFFPVRYINMQKAFDAFWQHRCRCSVFEAFALLMSVAARWRFPQFQRIRFTLALRMQFIFHDYSISFSSL